MKSNIPNGVTYQKHFGDFVSYEAKINAFDLGIDNKQAIAVAFDVGGTGRGLELLFVLTFTDDLEFLPLPKHSRNNPLEDNGSFGFRARVAYIDDYKANVICNEAGFTEDIPLDRELYESYAKNNDGIMPIIYDDNGKLKGEINYSEIGVDGICDVSIVDINGRQCVEFAQYVWGLSHGNGIGFLISALA